MIYVYDTLHKDYKNVMQLRQHKISKLQRTSGAKERPKNLLYVCKYKMHQDLYIDYIELRAYVDFISCPYCKTRTGRLKEQIEDPSHKVALELTITCDICQSKLALNDLVKYMIRLSADEIINGKLDLLSSPNGSIENDVLISRDELGDKGDAWDNMQTLEQEEDEGEAG